METLFLANGDVLLQCRAIKKKEKKRIVTFHLHWVHFLLKRNKSKLILLLEQELFSW